MNRLSDKRIRARNSSAWLLPNDGTRTDHGLRRDMRRYADGDEVDLVVVGAGAGGGVLTQRLARAGWKVVCLDAGPFWDPDADWVSDERGAHVLYWTEPRLIGGADPVPLGSNNSGRGVGGSMVHFAGYVPRFHPSDFATRTNNGVGADWPISYGELRPYYQLIEEELPVALREDSVLSGLKIGQQVTDVRTDILQVDVLHRATTRSARGAALRRSLRPVGFAPHAARGSARPSRASEDPPGRSMLSGTPDRVDRAALG